MEDVPYFIWERRDIQKFDLNFKAIIIIHRYTHTTSNNNFTTPSLTPPWKLQFVNEQVLFQSSVKIKNTPPTAAKIKGTIFMGLKIAK